MDQMSPRTLTIGAWTIDRLTGEMTGGGEPVRLEMRALALLLFLAEHRGKVVSINEILDRVWSDVTVSSDSVYQAIKSLRKCLGDDSRNPAYIVTVPKLGYKLLAGEPAAVARKPRSRLWPAIPVLLLLAGAAFLLTRPGHDSEIRLAVMPFADMTDSMDKEPFADRLSVHLIDAMSRVPGIKVAARGAVFPFKDKAAAPADVARTLEVDHVVEGSVDSAEGTLRITVQLIRTGDSVVAWSASYDRPAADPIAVEDEIAIDLKHAVSEELRTNQR